jgi:hypothetical protein
MRVGIAGLLAPRPRLARPMRASGQLCVYLRLLNVPVPSVYGPTADENPFGPPAVTPAASITPVA